MCPNLVEAMLRCPSVSASFKTHLPVSARAAVVVFAREGLIARSIQRWVFQKQTEALSRGTSPTALYQIRPWTSACPPLSAPDLSPHGQEAPLPRTTQPTPTTGNRRSATTALFTTPKPEWFSWSYAPAEYVGRPSHRNCSSPGCLFSGHCPPLAVGHVLWPATELLR